MAIPFALLQGLGAGKGILPPGMGIARGVAPAAGMASATGALSAPAASSLSVAPASVPAAPPVAAPNYTPNPYTEGTGGANAGGGNTGGGNYGSGSITPGAAGTGAVAGAGATAPTIGPVAQAAPTASSDNNPEQTSWGAGINPYTRSSDWLTSGGGSHVMQGIVNRDPFAARGMEGDLGAYGINVPNTGSLKPSDVGLGNHPMSRDPYSAREAATGFGPTYGHTPTAPADAPHQEMGYGIPTPGYMNLGGSHQIDNPIATPPIGGPIPSNMGDSFQGYGSPRPDSPTRDAGEYPAAPAPPSNIATTRARVDAATSPYQPATPFYTPSFLDSGTSHVPIGGPVPPEMGRFDPSPAPYLDTTGVSEEVFSGPDRVAAAPAASSYGAGQSYGGYRGGTSPPGFLSGTGSSHPYDPLSSIRAAPVVPKGEFEGPNPFAGPLGDIFATPSQQAIDQFAGGAGVAPPATSSLPGFLEAGGTARIPQYRPSIPGANPRPQQPGDITGPSNIPPPQFTGNLPQARPDYARGSSEGTRGLPQFGPWPSINPFTGPPPTYGYPRPPRPRPDNYGPDALRGSYG